MAEKFDPAPVDKHSADPNEAANADREMHDKLKAGLVGSFPASDPASITQPSPSKHDNHQHRTTDQKKLSAYEVHELLLSAHPHLTEVNLTRAAELAAPEHDATAANKNFRGDTFLAIQAVRKGIAEGASGAEGEQLLLKAIRAAEHWVAACG